MPAPPTTPAHLHAHASLWSLRVAYRELASVHHDLRWGSMVDSGVRSATFATGGRPVGGTPFGLGDLLSVGRDHRYAQLGKRVEGTVRWLAARLGAPPGPPLAALASVLFALSEHTAQDLARWLAEQDQRIRQTLGLGDDHQPVPGNPPCPSCGARLLRQRTSPPDPADRVVICLGEPLLAWPAGALIQAAA